MKKVVAFLIFLILHLGMMIDFRYGESIKNEPEWSKTIDDDLFCPKRGLA
ncbi:MAG: hypothetical protein ACFE95_15780 [Candidatus Hodarchaeota archaeon]